VAGSVTHNYVMSVRTILLIKAH